MARIEWGAEYYGVPNEISGTTEAYYAFGVTADEGESEFIDVLMRIETWESIGLSQVLDTLVWDYTISDNTGTSIFSLDYQYFGGDFHVIPLKADTYYTIHTQYSIPETVFGVEDNYMWLETLWDVNFIGVAERPAPIPEPSTILLLGVGLSGLLVCVRKWKKRTPYDSRGFFL